MPNITIRCATCGAVFTYQRASRPGRCRKYCDGCDPWRRRYRLVPITDESQRRVPRRSTKEER